jgi:transcriptional regulator with XRE-family HTH domain
MDKKLYAAPGLRTAREEKGLMQKEMVELLNMLTETKISLSLYQKWEQGIASVTLDTAIQISKALEKPISRLWEAKKREDQPQEQVSIDEQIEADNNMDYVKDLDPSASEKKPEKKHGLFK